MAMSPLAKSERDRTWNIKMSRLLLWRQPLLKAISRSVWMLVWSKPCRLFEYANPLLCSLVAIIWPNRFEPKAWKLWFFDNFRHRRRAVRRIHRLLHRLPDSSKWFTIYFSFSSFKSVGIPPWQLSNRLGFWPSKVRSHYCIVQIRKEESMLDSLTLAFTLFSKRLLMLVHIM